jgi:hypothetical protein
MTRYRLEATTMVDEADLTRIVAALTGAGIEVRLGPVIEPEDVSEHPIYRSQATSSPFAPKTRAKRSNGAEWPAEGSIYSTVLKALESGEKTTDEVREALRAGDFASSSAASALARLVKSGKAKRTSEGGWVAA